MDEQTINTSTLTLMDWKAIAAASGNASGWAFHQWVKNNAEYNFGGLTMMDLVKLSQSVGLSLQEVCLQVSAKVNISSK